MCKMSNMQSPKVMKCMIILSKHFSVHPRILDIWIILQDKTLFCALDASDIVCWLVNQSIAKLDLFKSLDCRLICKTYAGYCYRNSTTVHRLVQSPTLQSTIFCDVHSDIRGKGIRVSPAWYIQVSRGTHLFFYLELFHNRSKGESVKLGGKASDSLCNELWRLNTGNMDDSVTQDTYSWVHAYCRVIESWRTLHISLLHSNAHILPPPF